MKEKLAVTAFALIAVAGTMHAHASGSLSGWYEDAFRKEREGIAAAAEQQAAKLLADFGTYVMSSKDRLTADILSLAETEEERVARELEAHRLKLEAELEQSAAAIREDLKDGTAGKQLEAEIESDVNRILEDVLSEH
ncbi:hypothetical protein SAMN04488127_0538 [Bhargavaea ginsengi]|uniref:Uncharacterized protein n=1 Tax=Bhargavaea ginsengi TaxID=426757 RepID=A0A1H6TWS3_9BACL|nr:hypothetical protein [Bhargavaea ginsengi]SEI81687.1 hypothetical protein SAMN04488127_0538 [Bhargavaea ginsengi]